MRGQREREIVPCWNMVVWGSDQRLTPRPGPSVDSSLQARDVLISGVMLMSGATKGGDGAVLMSDVNRHRTGTSVFF